MTGSLYCAKCGKKLLIYKNPQRAVCPVHGRIDNPKQMLIPDPKMDTDRRFWTRSRWLRRKNR